MFDVEFGGITRYPTEKLEGITKSVIKFHFLDKVDDEEIGQKVELELRVNTRLDMSLGDIHEDMLKFALCQLQRVLDKCEGKSAKEIMETSARDWEARFTG